jgi:cytochrome c oxidase subunit 2
VLHSFNVPEFRVKNDAVPGNYTTVWFEATRVGETLLQCTEYCGKDHSNMLARVRVLEEPDFNKWLETEGTPQGPPEEIGKKLYAERGCVGCHTLDGVTNPGGGPSFKGLFGKTEQFTDGTSAEVNDDYIRESILNPSAKVVKGFPAGVMPAFQGQLSDVQINGLIAFIKAQK